MGCWSVCCGISNIAITDGNECVILPLKKNKSLEYREWQPATLPIFGEYNDYGGMDDIVKDDNTAMIENHFGISIEEFVTFLVDGKHTYDRDEAKEVYEKIKNNKELEDWRFMWIDKKVYDYMIVFNDKYHKGYMDYGTKEMLTIMGFTKVKSAEINNYDPKRFKELWKKGDVELYSDGKTLLNKKNNYIYHFGHGDETSIETYFDVPENLQHLKNQSKVESWRFLSTGNRFELLGGILGDKYEFGYYDSVFNPSKKRNISEKIYNKYMNDLDTFGDRIANLWVLNSNLHPMSGQLVPHTLYLTPQCGEYNRHQEILEKFAEINKSYCQDQD